jgi:hypothetical protein
MNKAFVFWSGILAVLLFIAAVITGGFQLPGYSHVSQLISESYAIGTPYGIQLRYLMFAPSGILIAIFALGAGNTVATTRISKTAFYGIAVFYGIATLVVSLFPCDEGCDKQLVNPSIAQLIHNFSGLLTYLIVPVCLLVLGLAAHKWPQGKFMAYTGIICGLVCIIFIALLSSDVKSAFAGLYQRIIEGSILFWITACAFYVRKLS